MKRRIALATLSTLAAGSFSALQAQTTAASAAPVAGSAAALVKAGGCVVMLRHAQTEPGVGDPPGFRLDQCATQRNLSDAGRAQSRRIGLWFSSRGLVPAAVRSSEWCRCKDTAELAFGRFEVLPALSSTFAGQGDERQSTPQLRALAGKVAAGRFEVWVTHQVNITALTGDVPAMGEAYILGPDAKILARTTFG